MISMYAEYSGRTLYVALSSDNIVGAKNGDTLYEMDTGKRYVYNESNDAWDEQPEEGGGGGGYSADDNVTIRLGNKTGITTPARSVYYDPVLSGIFPSYTITSIPKNEWRELKVLNQNGWFSVWLKFNSEYTPRSVTYNGNNLPFEKSGNNANWSLKIQMPDNYDPQYTNYY